MINKINLGFGDERSFLKKEKVIKIYNRGNIVTSRPKSARNNYEILSIKNFESPEKRTNKINSIKKIIKPKKIKKQKIENETDKIKNVGFILRKSFTREELENIIDFGPSANKNRIKLKNEKKEEEAPKKLKPYIPDIKYEDDSKEVNERYLQRTINIYKENEYLIKKVTELLKNSKNINENKLKKEKEDKLKRINKKRNLIRKFIANKREEIKNKDIKNEVLWKSETLNGDNLKNKENKEENNNNKKGKKEIIKREENGNDFIEIIDIKKDLKYIMAEKWMKDSKEECEKMKDLLVKIDQRINEDKIIIKNPEVLTDKTNKIAYIENAKQIISNVKNNLDSNNFDINKLNKEDQKLLKGAKRYNPNQRIKNIRNKKINKDKEPILINSINSIGEIKEANKNMKEIFKQKNKLDKKEKEISKEWKNNNESAKAYLNNFRKGQKININEIKVKKDIVLENKNDIYNYIYMPKEYENHWYNIKDTNDKTEYRHPFLIYDE